MGIDMQLICPAPPQIYYYLPLEVGVDSRPHAQRRHRRICRQTQDRLVALGGVPTSGRQRGGQGARALHEAPRLQGRRNSHQRQRKGTLRSGFRAVLEEGRGTGRACFYSPDRLHAAAASLRAFTSTTSSAIRSIRPWRCITSFSTACSNGTRSFACLRPTAAAFSAAYSGRIDHAWGARSDAHGNLPQPPTTYLRRNVYLDTVVFTPQQLEALVKTYRCRSHRAGHRLSVRHART